MSVYSPYSRYSLYGAPSAHSYYPYAGSSPYGGYSSYGGYGGGGSGTGVVSERIYFSLNGKLIRSYKIRSYRVRQFFTSWLGRNIQILTSTADLNPESTETCPGPISRHAVRHCLFPHPILCDAYWICPWTIRRLEVIHIKERVANRNRSIARARDDRDRG